MENYKNILDFISEAGMLKQMPRSGWSVLGIKNPESVADHSFRCAVIGYLLARIEGADAYQVMFMCLFGDICEARITDLHKMAQKYIKSHEVEDKSLGDQAKKLPKQIKDEVLGFHQDYRNQKTKESKIARDADILECLIQAKEYYEQGHLQAKKFMQKAPKYLVMKSSQKIWELAKKSSLNDWWFRLSEFER